MREMKVLTKRQEFLFLYDVEYANPNGDAEDNIPRNDGEYIIVSPFRLKRTIRDYLLLYKNHDIFVRKEYLDKTKLTLKNKDQLYSKYSGIKDILEKCIDIRLFGGAFALKQGDSFSLIGPVQFSWGKSIHPANYELMKGTCVIPSSSDKSKSENDTKKQGTFTETYVVPYAVIAFWGWANENIVKREQLDCFGVALTEKDIEDMIEAMWNGTRNLTSMTKVGQSPKFLLQIVYKENYDFHIARLHNLIECDSEKNVKNIKDIKLINLEKIENAIIDNKDKIDAVYYAINNVNLPINFNIDKLKNAGIIVQNKNF